MPARLHSTDCPISSTSPSHPLPPLHQSPSPSPPVVSRWGEKLVRGETENHGYCDVVATAAAVASTGFTSLKRSTVFGAGVQGLRAANQKTVKLAAVPSCGLAKLSTSSSGGLAQQDAVGANGIAGTEHALHGYHESLSRLAGLISSWHCSVENRDAVKGSQRCVCPTA